MGQRLECCSRSSEDDCDAGTAALGGPMNCRSYNATLTFDSKVWLCVGTIRLNLRML